MTGQTIIYNTLIPVLEKHRNAFGDTLEAVTADSGYCSEKNLLYLKENEIKSFIKLQDHEKRKTRAYKEDIGKYSNMTYAVLKMSIITSAMMEGSCAISGRKAKNRTAILRRWRSMAVRTAAAVSINPNVFTDTMQKKSGVLITGQRRKYIKSSCCMQ